MTAVNATLGNLVTSNYFAGVLTTAAQPNITSVGTLTSLTVTGNTTSGNLNTAGIVTASRLISNIATGTAPFTVTSTTQVANLNVATAGLATFATTANAVAGANVSGQVSNALVAGTVYTNAQPNITSVGTLTTVTVSGNANVGNILTDNYKYANGTSISFTGTYSNSNVSSFLAVYGSNTISTTGNITAGNIITTVLTAGANTTAGNITGNWTLTAGSKLEATYADLAEYYEADRHYEPGTVLAFGGDKEVTMADTGTTKVAGIVSTNPSYVMNSSCPGEYIVALALQGRVPCKIRGNIKKGDMLISAGNGFAHTAPFPILGTVIGKSLENFDGIEGIIQVAVGRL